MFDSDRHRTTFSMDDDHQAKLLKIKGILEKDNNKLQSMSKTIAFLMDFYLDSEKKF